jgi:hypothetical protein
MPFSPRVRNSALLATLALLSACRDVVAPVVTELQQVAANLSNAVTCTNTWTTPTSGLWSDASRWSKGAVPTSADNACVTLEGNYTVSIMGWYAANSLTIGTPSGNDKPKVSILGYRYEYATGARLTVANGIDNYGWLELNSAGANPGGAELVVDGGTFYNHDIASFRSLPGTESSPTRSIHGTIVNDGTMAFDAYTTGDGSITNNALFSIPASGGLFLRRSKFVQANGTFDIGYEGALTVVEGEFHVDGGAMTGSAPVFVGIALGIGSPSTDANLVLRGVTTFTGNVGAGQVLRVDGWQPPGGYETAAALNWTTGFTNAGTIRMTATGSPIPGGVALNGPADAPIVNTGRIESLTGPTNSRQINASIDNRAGGVVDLQQSATFAREGATLTNAGAWKLAPGQVLYVQAYNVKFIQNAGTLELDGATYQQVGYGEVFEMNGGTITGEPAINGTLRIGAGSTATGRVRLNGNATLVGDVMHGQSIIVPGYPGYSSTLEATTSFTNHGTITLTNLATNAGIGLINVTNGATMTNAPDGRIEAIPGVDATGHGISGNFDNKGTLHVATMTYLHGPTIHTSGPITGTGELRNWLGATMFATGSVQANLLNAGAFHVGQAIGQPGQLNIAGYFYMYTGSLNVDIGGSVPGTDFDQITVGGSAASAGILNVATSIGRCAGGGSSYEIIKAASHSGDYGSKTGLDLGGGRTVTTVSGPTSYALNVSGPACIPPDVTPPVIEPGISGTLGNNGWYRSDVSVSWNVSDEESAVTSQAGCGTTTLTTDNAGTTYTCSATSAGGTATQSVTVKRDATAPVVTVTRTPAPGADGWNETDVTVTWTASDALSGVAGAATYTQVFSVGADQGASHSFADRAGNSATGTISGIHIRPPVTSGGDATGSATPGEIWPANNKMVAVRVTMCAGVTSFTLRSVTNNETGMADAEGWAIGTADLNGFVRAARKGNGNGRTYTLVYDTMSVGGATGTCTVTVRVPHDQGR